MIVVSFKKTSTFLLIALSLLFAIYKNNYLRGSFLRRHKRRRIIMHESMDLLNDILPRKIVLNQKSRYKLIENKGNGNCFYYSLIEYLDNITINELRNKIVNYIKNDTTNYFHDFYCLNKNEINIDDNVNSWDEFLYKKKYENTWANEIDVNVIKELFNVCVIIYQQIKYNELIFYEILNENMENCWNNLTNARILLNYSGFSHYEAIILKQNHTKISIEEHKIIERKQKYDIKQIRIDSAVNNSITSFGS